MKRLLILCLVILGVAFIAPVLAHHMAEGIISDEIWERVDILLEDTLHDDAVESMTAEEDDDGDWRLVSSIVVLTEDVAVYMEALDTVILEMESAMQRIPSGTRTSVDDVDPEDDFANLLVYPVEIPDSDMSTIYLIEPVGAGDSQDGDGVTTPPSGNGGNR